MKEIEKTNKRWRRIYKVGEEENIEEREVILTIKKPIKKEEKRIRWKRRWWNLRRKWCIRKKRGWCWLEKIKENGERS